MICTEECMIEKRNFIDGEPELLQYSVKEIDGRLCVTHFYIDYKDYKILEPHGNIREEIFDIIRFDDNDGDHRFHGRHPYTLPFSTGNLVRLDPPCYEKTVFGVILNTKDPCGFPYIWMECSDGHRFTTESLSYHMIEVASEYCVIDWLHSTSESELPKGQKSLADIGKKLHSIAKKR